MFHVSALLVLLRQACEPEPEGRAAPLLPAPPPTLLLGAAERRSGDGPPGGEGRSGEGPVAKTCSGEGPRTAEHCSSDGNSPTGLLGFLAGVGTAPMLFRLNRADRAGSPSGATL